MQLKFVRSFGIETFSDFYSISLGKQINHHGDQNVQHCVFRYERCLENDVGRR